jgi:hypothetical protein
VAMIAIFFEFKLSVITSPFRFLES